MVETLTREALRDILAFYQEAGVDEPLEETPPNRLLSAAKLAERQPALPRAEATPRPPDPAAPARPPTRQSPAEQPRAERRAPTAEQSLYDAVPDRPVAAAAVPDEGQVLLARELAQKAQTLDELHAHMAAFEG